AQIGDGAVVVGVERGTFDLLSGPPQTEHLNETIFLTADRALDHAQVKVRSGHVRFGALLCDGLQLLALKYPELAPHAGFFGPLFGFLEKAGPGEETAARLRQFLGSPRVTARSDDDLSIVLAVLREQTVP
ncbi:MAG: protein phosphatase 2C domain-containing protein, partial [Verrucomicrobiia bacterium]